VILGGLAGGAAATVIEGRAPGDLVAISPAPTSIPSSAPVNVPAGSDTIVDAVRELLPAVVTVVNKAASGQAQSSGSGFVIDAQQGYIATNNHVVENGRGGVGASFDVIFSDNRTVKATLVGRDAQTDVAVLKVPAQGLVAAPLADSEKAPVGAMVVAIGSPLGEFQNTVTQGVVSAKGRRVQESSSVTLEDMIQTDAAINPGNSGGPMLGLDGKVVGIANAVNTTGQGIGFAIPVDVARAVVDELRVHGRVKRGWLGVSVVDLTPDVARNFGRPSYSGVVVSEVVSGSPAQRAGLRAGDIILEVDRTPVQRAQALRWKVAQAGLGSTLRVRITRAGHPSLLAITPISMPAMATTSPHGVLPPAGPEAAARTTPGVGEGPNAGTGGSGTDQASGP
jgi:serine protease Do